MFEQSDSMLFSSRSMKTPVTRKFNQAQQVWTIIAAENNLHSYLSSTVKLLPKLRHPSRANVRFPFVEQRPIDGAGAEVGHVLVLGQTVDGLLDNVVVTAKDGAVTWQ